jgi:hypothetical protein
MVEKTAETGNRDKAHGSLAAIFAVFAFVACNGMFVLIAVFSLIGISISINPHIQAAAISLFSVVTLVMVISAFKKNRAIGPLILAIAATVTMIATMYIHFNKIVESLGLFALFASALWSWQISKARGDQKSKT